MFTSHNNILDNLFIIDNIQKQSKLNRSVATLAFAVTAYVIMVEIRQHDQNRKIAKLRKEIKELKRRKGE